MTIQDGFAADTINGEVIYPPKQVYRFSWETTPAEANAPKPKTDKAKKDDKQLMLF